MTEDRNEWQPLESIPRDGREIELLSPQKGIDLGKWYYFHIDSDSPPYPEWTPEVGDDWKGGLSTNEGFGDYTHWREKECGQLECEDEQAENERHELDSLRD